METNLQALSRTREHIYAAELQQK